MNKTDHDHNKTYYISHEYMGTIIHTIENGGLDFVEYDALGLSADIVKKIDEAEALYYQHLDPVDDRTEVDVYHQKQYNELMADIIRHILTKLSDQDQLV